MAYYYVKSHSQIPPSRGKPFKGHLEYFVPAHCKNYYITKVIEVMSFSVAVGPM